MSNHPRPKYTPHSLVVVILALLVAVVAGLCYYGVGAETLASAVKELVGLPQGLGDLGAYGLDEHMDMGGDY